MINLIHTSNGFSYCKDLHAGNLIYSNNELIQMGKEPILSKCWRIKTDINIDVICNEKFNGNKIYFAGTHAYGENSNYGYYVLGFLQLSNMVRGQNQLVYGKDTTYRLLRSIAILEHKVPNLSMSTSGKKTLKFPESYDKNSITDVNDLSEDSIRWFLQAYLPKVMSGTIRIKKREPNGVFTLKMRSNHLTFMGALMMRLANIVFYYCDKIEDGMNNLKGNIKDCYVFPVTESHKILSIIPYSSDMPPQMRRRFGQKRFAKKCYTDALKYRRAKSNCTYAHIIAQEEVTDYIIPGFYPDCNGFITKEVI